MPRHAIPTPNKTCEWCGEQFSRKHVGKARMLECVSAFMRKRFCSISCSASYKRAARRVLKEQPSNNND